MRATFLTILLTLIIMWHMVFGIHEYLAYFTNWGTILTIGSLCLTIYTSCCGDYRERPNLMVVNHVFMSLSIFCLLIIVPVYWSACHNGAMERAGDNTFEKFYQCINHILPGLACLYNFFATDFLFYRGYYKVTLSIGVLYLSMSFIKS